MNKKNNTLSVIILGAGNGTRMKSSLTKILNKVAGISMIEHVINTAETLGTREIVVVVSKNNIEQIRKVITNNEIKTVIQKELNGTGGATKTGLEKIDKASENTLIMYGDVPLITQETYQKMTNQINQENNSIVVLGFKVSDIKDTYGRLITDENNVLNEIIEYKDASEDERKIRLCNSGIIIVKTKLLLNLLNKVKNENASKEYYLTDIVGIARKQGLVCKYIEANEDEVMGVNTQQHLAKANKILQNRLRKKFMEQGVTLLDPDTTYFSLDTEIGKDVVIYPNVFFGAGVKIKDKVTIKPFSYLEKCVIQQNKEKNT
jgi:bifunctional UDP-N-acetylglucosamine pyrophosphorylase / glucosamine-1-phosphate N-acetyltransferase